MLDGDTLPVSIPQPKWCQNWVCRGHTSPHKVVEVLNNAEIAITNKVKLSAKELKNLPKLRYICVAATGYDCIDIDFCFNKKIAVSNVPNYANNSVAETVICYIFALRRHLLEYNTLALNKWNQSPVFCLHGNSIEDIEKSTLGIIGKGSIGETVAIKAGCLGMKVMFAERKGVSRLREGHHHFDDVISQSDIITLHCPLSPQTYMLIDKNTIRKMKSNALLINAARGGLVDEVALAEAIINNRLGGAALDVLEKEPPYLPTPILSKEIKRLIFSPHIAWASQLSIRKLALGIINNLSSWYLGKLSNRII